jgi:eukaryotic-like serine/threonine-protein kinase
MPAPEEPNQARAEAEAIAHRIRGVVARATKPLTGRDLPEGIHLEQPLGEGATSVVYLGRKHTENANLPDVVAVKVFKPWILNEPDEPERIARELELFTSVRHQNLMRVFGAGVLEEASPPCVYMLNEFVEGVTLDAFLVSGTKPLTFRNPRFTRPQLTRALLTQLCNGLAHLHQRGIVHRDLKPTNIKVIGDVDSSFEVKVLDFGVAKRQDQPHLTDSAHFLGTLRYSAPEWVRSEDGKRVSPQIDVYSVGAILYSIVNDEEPFKDAGRNRAEIETLILSGKPMFPEKPPNDLFLEDETHAEAEFFRALGKWLTEFDPSLRPASIVEVGEIFAGGVDSPWWRARIGMELHSRVMASDLSKPPGSPSRFPLGRGVYVGALKGYIQEATKTHLASVVAAWILGSIESYIHTGNWVDGRLDGVARELAERIRLEARLPKHDFDHFDSGWDDGLWNLFLQIGFPDAQKRGSYVPPSDLPNLELRRELTDRVVSSVREGLAGGDALFRGTASAVEYSVSDKGVGEGWVDWWGDHFDAGEACCRATWVSGSNEMMEFFMARAIGHYEAALSAGPPLSSDRDATWERTRAHIGGRLEHLRASLARMVPENKHAMPIFTVEAESERFSQREVVQSTALWFAPLVEGNRIVSVAVSRERPG